MKLLNRIMAPISLIRFKVRWRKRNPHNLTTAANIFPVNKVKVGNWTYGALFIRHFGGAGEELEIGSYCSIAGDVRFILGGEHDYHLISTYPFRMRMLGGGGEALSKGKITIRDDVWIGERATILSGVTIGQGAIIAAGSVVVKDIPPYAIFAGGKVVKYRFGPEVVNELLKIHLDDIPVGDIRGNIDLFYKTVDRQLLQSRQFRSVIMREETRG